jgi:hypothetical protein
LDPSQSFGTPFSTSLANSTIQGKLQIESNLIETQQGSLSVVGVYTTHMPDVTCSPTLSNLILRDQQSSTLLDTNLMTIGSAPQELLFNTGGEQTISLNPNLITIDGSLDDNVDA